MKESRKYQRIEIRTRTVIETKKENNVSRSIRTSSLGKLVKNLYILNL